VGLGAGLCKRNSVLNILGMLNEHVASTGGPLERSLYRQPFSSLLHSKHPGATSLTSGSRDVIGHVTI